MEGFKCVGALQVHVYLPSKLHPAHDTVRVIVKDSTNTFNGDDTRVFLDSGERPCIYCSCCKKGMLYVHERIVVSRFMKLLPYYSSLTLPTNDRQFINPIIHCSCGCICIIIP